MGSGIGMGMALGIIASNGGPCRKWEREGELGGIHCYGSGILCTWLAG